MLVRPMVRPMVELINHHNESKPDIRLDVKEVQYERNVLSITWRSVVAFAWIQFIAFELGMVIDRFYSKEPLCPHSDHDYPRWYWNLMWCCLGGFVMIWLSLLMKVLSVTKDQQSPLMVALHIVSMGMIATFIPCFVDAGVCIDVLNVASPAPIWGEWMACGPLLVYITLTIVDKSALNRVDIFITICFWLCLVTGWFIIFPQPYESGMFWFLVSCLTYLPMLYLPFYSANSDSTVFTDHLHPAKQDTTLSKIFNARFAQRRNLSLWLTVVLPLYTVNYIVALAGGYGPAETNAIYQVLSVLTKGLFAAATMDAHLALMVEAEKAFLEEKRANEARRAFMKYIFHEVRTPLNSLTMGIDLISTSPRLDENDRDSIDIMQAASAFMTKTLDGVLSMHKIEEGRFELEFSEMSISEVILGVRNAFRGTVVRKGLTVNVEISPLLPDRVVADAVRVEHTISNLLSNAVKFTAQGTIITIRASLVDDVMHLFNHRQIADIPLASLAKPIKQGYNNSASPPPIFGTSLSSNGSSPSSMPSSSSIAYVLVTVQDQGPGISQEHVDLIFDQFTQIRPQTLQSGQGSGLGLSFCKKIVELHGGFIDVVSEGQVGKGSTFRFVIPFKVVNWGNKNENSGAENSAQIEEEKVSASETRGASSPNHETIALPLPAVLPRAATLDVDSPKIVFDRSGLEVLVVDDADSNRKILIMLLTRKGIKCVGAEDGKIALDIVTADLERFKLVLMDNLMPNMNGIDSTSQMRRAGFKYIIAGLTGNVTEQDVTEYLNEGADLVLHKPLNVEMIDKLIHFVETAGPLSRSNTQQQRISADSGVDEDLKSPGVSMMWVPKSKSLVPPNGNAVSHR